jgi:GGDEF domain-containing protein
MRKAPFRPTPLWATILLLLFGFVWMLAAWDLTFAGSFLAAILVAGVVAALIYIDFPADAARERGGNRLLDLMQRGVEGRRGIRDETTGLLTRWYLEQRLDEEAARCDRYGYSMAIVVLKAVAIDLARFSLDSWQVESAEAAKRCALVVRNVDLSASLAPFEFAMCLIHCDREGAAAVADRIAAEFRDYDCRIGIAVYPADDCEPRALIEVARVRARQPRAA